MLFGCSPSPFILVIPLSGYFRAIRLSLTDLDPEFIEGSS